ncbi:hypothetical protein ABZ468_07830 [Streptomyces sp. NPDC005708]|uniref:hypothetical protein n=1 Tax=Streptomyces sp. NPDC005708 TaxID=3154564 RepID=UPI0033CCF950
MTPEILARITAARAARDLSDLARQAVGTTAAPMSPAERIQAARYIRQMANELVNYVVLAEVLAGAEWADITQALNRRDPRTVEGEYADAVAAWRALQEEEMTVVAEGTQDLDDWYARHREDHDPAVENPVSDLRNRH